MSPLLLIDIDGPLNPYAASWFRTRRPADGFDFHDLTPQGERAYRVALNPEHGAWLRELSAAYELAWASTWQHEANRLVAPLLGLPGDLPVVPLRTPPGWTARRSWKTEQIIDWVGLRPFAWFDDEINRQTRDWLAHAGLGPHLALRIEPHIGLRRGDIDRLAAFAHGLDPA